MDRNNSDNNDNGYASTFQIHTQDKVLTKIDYVSVRLITHWWGCK